MTTQAALVPATTTTNSGIMTAADIASEDLAASSAFGLDPDSGWFRYFSVWGWQFIAGGFPVNMLSYLAQVSSAQALQGGVATDIFGGLSEGAADLSAADASLVSAAGSSLAPRATLGIGISLGNLTMPPATVGMLGSSAPVQLASRFPRCPRGSARHPCSRWSRCARRAARRTVAGVRDATTTILNTARSFRAP